MQEDHIWNTFIGTKPESEFSNDDSGLKKTLFCIHKFYENQDGYNGKYTHPMYWTAEERRFILNRLKEAVYGRTNKILTAMNKKPLPNFDNTKLLLVLLGLKSTDEVFEWIASIMPGYMSIGMWMTQYRPVSKSKRINTLINIGHVEGVETFDKEEENWFLKANHHSNLGFQFGICNMKYMFPLLYPRELTPNGFVDSEEYDTPKMKKMRELYYNRETRLLHYLSELRILHFGRDTVVESPNAYRRLYDKRWNADGSPTAPRSSA